MNHIVAFAQRIRLRKIMTVFLAGMLLCVSTACSGAKNLQARAAGDLGSHPAGQAQPLQGGMNNFSDTDPRVADKSTSAKAKGLKDNAERNLNNRIDSVEQYVDNYTSGAPLGERTERVVDRVKEGVENFAEDASELGDVPNRTSYVKSNRPNQFNDYTKNGTDYSRADKDMGRTYDQGKSSRDANQAVENIKDNSQAAGRDVINNAKSAINKVGNKVSDFAKDNSIDSGNAAQRTIDNAADAVKNRA